MAEYVWREDHGTHELFRVEPMKVTGTKMVARVWQSAINSRWYEHTVVDELSKVHDTLQAAKDAVMAEIIQEELDYGG